MLIDAKKSEKLQKDLKKNQMVKNEASIIALATPPGLGAIGVLRLSGHDSIKICNSVFKGKNLLKVLSHTVHLGKIMDEDVVLDEVLVTIFVAPKSYTKENVVEIACHGSPFIQQKILELFIRKGARMAKQGEFTLRAFLNGRFDLSQAEAVADLIAADSDFALESALKQMRGGFSEEIKALREQLIHFASMLELELDFGEEDVEFVSRDELKSLILKILKVINELKNSFQLGNVLKNGVSTVIAGKPNAGKSTLLNALLNEERAIVSAIPGTTRDVVEDVMVLNGIKFRFSDTAGIRDSEDEIENIGVNKTFEHLQKASLVLYLFDVLNTKPIDLKTEIENLNLNTNEHLILVGNKIENKNLGDLKTQFADFQDIIWISAKEKENISELKNRLTNSVSNQNIQENNIVTNARHYEALQETAQALEKSFEGINLEMPSDLIALDVRRALHFLGLITGEISTDDLLENIFSKFCIGK